MLWKTLTTTKREDDSWSVKENLEIEDLMFEPDIVEPTHAGVAKSRKT